MESVLSTGPGRFLNEAVCAECGGGCCERYPGAPTPSDFKKPVMEHVKRALRSGQWKMDSWCGDPRKRKDELHMVLFIRPRIVAKSGLISGDGPGIYYESWGGPCVFLEKEGCVLPHDERPSQCKDLEPVPRNSIESCKHHGLSKRAAIVKWIPYQSQLQEILNNGLEEE